MRGSTWVRNEIKTITQTSNPEEGRKNFTFTRRAEPIEKIFYQQGKREVMLRSWRMAPLTCALSLQKCLHRARVCAHIKALQNTMRQWESEGKLETGLVVFLLRLLDYVGLWNLHLSLNTPQLWLTSSHLVLVTDLLSLHKPFILALHPELQSAVQQFLNLPNRFTAQVCFGACLQNKPLCLWKLLSFCMQLANKWATEGVEWIYK